MNELILENGKYRFYKPDGVTLVCDRYGQPWREFIGDKAVTALFDKYIELDERFNDYIENTQ